MVNDKMVNAFVALSKRGIGFRRKIGNRYRLLRLSVTIGLLFMILNGNIAQAQNTSPNTSHQVLLKSPDSQLEVQIKQTSSGDIVYNFKADGQMLLRDSRLGLAFAGATQDGLSRLRWKDVRRRSVNSSWKPLWGKRAVVPELYNEVTIDLDAYKIKARLYNNGFAFHYEDAKIDSELTTFNFVGDYMAWYYNGENANIGPEKLSAASGLRSPVMTIKADDRHFMAIHESDLESGEPLMLKTVQGSKLFSVPTKRGNGWRVIMFGRTPGALVDSHLIELLSPPPAAGSDFSWVKPGLAVWDWRINGAVTDDGFKYTMSWPSWKRMVDFASAEGIGSLVLDADWYGPEFDKGSDPTKGGKVEQVHRLIQYGHEKGVGIWLYLNDVGGHTFPLEQTLAQYGNWGAVGVKYGFMQGSTEEKNIHTRLITRLCAKYHLMVDFHDGPVHPYGQMRTWPNAVTREYCQSQSDAHKVFPPSTFVTSVFVNMLAGPLDMCNGAMQMDPKGRVDNPQRIPATITAEAARTLIVFSGATIIPDIPENYRKHPSLLKFIRSEKMPWKASETLAGVIGEYIVMARQSATGDWLIGASNNEKARDIKIDLSFLPKGSFKATIIRDGETANYLTNKTSSTTTVEKNLTKTAKINLTMAAGGGGCILLEKQ